MDTGYTGRPQLAPEQRDDQHHSNRAFRGPHPADRSLLETPCVVSLYAVWLMCTRERLRERERECMCEGEREYVGVGAGGCMGIGVSCQCVL